MTLMLPLGWCRGHGLLARSCHCAVCNEECYEGPYSRSPDKVIWRCSRCQKITNIRKGSFFEKSHLPLWKILRLAYAWSLNCGTSCGLSVKSMREFQIGSNKTVVDWMQFACDVTAAHFDNNHQPLRGPGCIVEIDQSICSP